ncbi:hypothetical protein BJ166DRAFT_125670 [Pestalotiopsis sp. NC0098]|nr:hypothetical protein BJ166DRAFT_125670 [Pestalotiopsis sp. NC0098]
MEAGITATTPIALLQARSIIGSGKFPSQANQDEHAPLVSTSQAGVGGLLHFWGAHGSMLAGGNPSRNPSRNPSNLTMQPTASASPESDDYIIVEILSLCLLLIPSLLVFTSCVSSKPSKTHRHPATNSSKRSSLLFHTPFSVLFENFLLICLSNLRIYKPFRVRDALPEFSLSTSILSLISNSVQRQQRVLPRKTLPTQSSSKLPLETSNEVTIG